MVSADACTVEVVVLLLLLLLLLLLPAPWISGVRSSTASSD
jgi:hypothetical protein